MHKGFLILPLLAILVLLAACGYNTPTGGGGITPYIVFITPTASIERLTASAQLTIEAMPTATPRPSPTPAPTANTTVATTKSATTAATLVVTGDTYTVQSGDTLLGIAIRLKVDYDDLVALNKITDPNNISIGQKLKLPPRSTPTPTR